MTTHASSPKALPTVLAPCRRRYAPAPLTTPKQVAFDAFVAQRNFWLEEDALFTKSTAADKALTLHNRKRLAEAIRAGTFRRMSYHASVDGQLTRFDYYVHVPSGQHLKMDVIRDILRGRCPAPLALPRVRPVDPRVKATASINRANFDQANLARLARLNLNQPGADAESVACPPPLKPRARLHPQRASVRLV
jgi:hypothetical protein